MTWIKYAELETLLGDEERARAVLQLAVQQSALDMPEVGSLLQTEDGGGKGTG